MTIIKRQQIASFGKDGENREPLCTFGGNVNWCSHIGKVSRFLKKFKNKAIIQSSNFTLGH